MIDINKVKVIVHPYWYNGRIGAPSITQVEEPKTKAWYGVVDEVVQDPHSLLLIDSANNLPGSISRDGNEDLGKIAQRILNHPKSANISVRLQAELIAHAAPILGKRLFLKDSYLTSDLREMLQPYGILLDPSIVMEFMGEMTDTSVFDFAISTARHTQLPLSHVSIDYSRSCTDDGWGVPPDIQYRSEFLEDLSRPEHGFDPDEIELFLAMFYGVSKDH